MSLSNIIKNVIFSALIIISVFSVYAAWPIGDVSNGEVVDASHINTIRDHTVPSGAVMSFNLASCPTGWSEYTAARGRAVIWVWQWNTAEWGWLGTNWSLGSTTGAETHTLTIPEIPSHNHTTTNAWAGPGASWDWPDLMSTTDTYNNVTNNIPSADIGWGWSHNIMQASVALLYCQKS